VEEDGKSLLFKGRAVEALTTTLGRRGVPTSTELKRKAWIRLRGINFRVSVRLLVRVCVGVLRKNLQSEFFSRKTPQISRYADLKFVSEPAPLVEHVKLVDVGVNTTKSPQTYGAVQVCRRIGNMMHVFEKKIASNFRSFLDRMRLTRKRQMEVAFLQAAVAELRRLEVAKG
jgi:hypothetical protein